MSTFDLDCDAAGPKLARQVFLSLSAGNHRSPLRLSGLIGAVVVVAMLALSACTLGSGSGDYRVSITQDVKLLASFSLDDVKTLPMVQMDGGDDVENGPTLLAVLQKAGVTQFSRVTAAGMQRGRVHSAELTLDRAKITDKVILAINKRGKLKLMGEGIPADGVIVDVTELRVE
jgi:hypothetical protein